jgi:predicted dehydrogenase
MNQVYSEAVEDISEAQIVYEGGISANIHVNWSDYTYRKPMLKMDIHGTKGKIQADLYGYRLFLREENKELGLPEGWTSVPMNMISDPCPFYVRGASFTKQLYEFANAVQAKRKSNGCVFREAVDTQTVIHTIFENK